MAPSKSAKSSTKPTKQPSTQLSSKPSPTSAPNWPMFKPRLPVVDITPEIHPDCSTIAIIRTFFPRALCQEYVNFLKTLAFQTTPTRPKKGEALRFNDRFQVDDPAFAGRLWAETGLREACSSDPELCKLWGGTPVGLNPNIRAYRYTKGQFFDCHYGLEGGETIFYPHDRRDPSEGISMAPETGMLLMHKHGNGCLFHEGAEVKAGEKWILRTDLCIDRREWTPIF